MADAEKKVGRRAAVTRLRARNARKAKGRKASDPLFVMLEPEQKERYRRLAEEMGMTLSDLVVNAIEQVAATHHAVTQTPYLLIPGNVDLPVVAEQPRAEVDVPWMMRTVTSLVSRLGALEDRIRSQSHQLEELQGGANRNWGTKWRDGETPSW